MRDVRPRIEGEMDDEDRQAGDEDQRRSMEALPQTVEGEEQGRKSNFLVERKREHARNDDAEHGEDAVDRVTQLDLARVERNRQPEGDEPRDQHEQPAVPASLRRRRTRPLRPTGGGARSGLVGKRLEGGGSDHADHDYADPVPALLEVTDCRRDRRPRDLVLERRGERTEELDGQDDEDGRSPEPVAAALARLDWSFGLPISDDRAPPCNRRPWDFGHSRTLRRPRTRVHREKGFGGNIAPPPSSVLLQNPQRLELRLEQRLVDLALIDGHAFLDADADDLLAVDPEFLGQLLGR